MMDSSRQCEPRTPLRVSSARLRRKTKGPARSDPSLDRQQAEISNSPQERLQEATLKNIEIAKGYAQVRHNPTLQTLGIGESSGSATV